MFFFATWTDVVAGSVITLTLTSDRERRRLWDMRLRFQELTEAERRMQWWRYNKEQRSVAWDTCFIRVLQSILWQLTLRRSLRRMLGLGRDRFFGRRYGGIGHGFGRAGWYGQGYGNKMPSRNFRVRLEYPSRPVKTPFSVWKA
jgi:hypothetical protein